MRRGSACGGLCAPFWGGQATGFGWVGAWRGEQVVIAASGPSLTEADLQAVAAWQGGSKKVIAINNTFQATPWADALYACDRNWWDVYQPEFDGLKFTQDKRAATYYDLTYVPSVDQPGLSLKAPAIHRGANGGYQAINLAVHLGVEKIILLGYDMQAKGKAHWHGNHAKGLNNPNEINFEAWLQSFEAVPDCLDRAGVEVVNCSRETALACFPRAELESVL